MKPQAHRTAAADKLPEDFVPPELPPVQKKFATLTVTRKTGEVERATIILRPGDVAAIDGKTVLEG